MAQVKGMEHELAIESLALLHCSDHAEFGLRARSDHVPDGQ